LKGKKKKRKEKKENEKENFCSGVAIVGTGAKGLRRVF
jgi:hypothetical protein